MNRLLLFTWVFFLPYWLSAQLDDLSIRRLTTVNGLSHNDVGCVFQDSRGFIWLGTTDGLNRYDGHYFQTFQIDPEVSGSLPSNLIFSIFEDENHILWIGTRHRRVCFFDLKTDQFVPAEKLPAQYQLPKDFIFGGVVQAGEGAYWVCGEGDILHVSSQGVRSLMQEGILPHGVEIKSPKIVSNQLGTCWVVGQNNYILYLSRNEAGDITLQSYHSGLFCNSLVPFEDGIILGVYDGVFVISPRLGRLIQVSDIPSFALGLQDTILWVGTADGIWTLPADSISASLFPEASSRKAEEPASSYLVRGKKIPRFSSYIFDIYDDQHGMVWIGTKGDGLIQFNTRPGRFRYYALKNNRGIRKRIRSIYEDHQGRIWVGTDGRGMYRFFTLADGRGYLGTASPVGDQERLIHQIRELKLKGRSYLYQGPHYPSRPKLFEINGEELNEVNEPNKLLSIMGNVTDVVQDSIWIWVSTYDRGIYRYNSLTDEINIIKFPGDTSVVTENKVRSLLIDRKGRLWIGGSRGLALVSAQEKLRSKPQMTFFRYDPKDPHSLSHDYVLPMYESEAGDIWIGTMGGGLNRWVESDRNFERWGTSEGLPSNTLKGILEDKKGDLWISSHKGISHFLRAEGRFINYGLSDGLQDFEFADLSCLKSSSGEMFFGGIRGINAFYPEEIQEDTSSTSVILTQLQILNEPVAPQEDLNGRILLTNHLNETPQLRLRHDESTLTLSFIGLNYPSPRKVHYEYMIENYDENWIRTGPSSRFAKYTKLPPGSYIFKVRASNSDGMWNGPVKTLAITVTPPWWKSQAAYACYLLLIVALIIFFQQYSLIRIQRKNELVMQQFEKEKVEELAQVKLRFFTNVSHEFRTPLTLIQGYLEKAINLVDGVVRKDLQIIQHNSRILLRLISELMDLQKLDQGKDSLKLQPYDLSELAKQSLTSFKWWAEQKGINLSLEAPDEPLLAWIDLHKIERVFYNLLSNAFKHTAKGGSIVMRIGADAEKIHISIEDNGAGIPKVDQPFIFKRFYQATQVKEMAQGGTGIGLAYAKTIVEKHLGKLYFESEEGQGTVFFIQLPKGREHVQPLAVIDSKQASPHTYSHEDGDLLNILQATSPSVPTEQRGANAARILLVEDNLPIRTMLKELLEPLYFVDEAEEGRQALDFCLNQQPDLVISDVMMPGMDGFTFCAQLKEDQQTSHIPVILLTAKDSSQMKLKGFEQGADAYVTKPFNIAVLKAQIKSVLNSRERLREKISQSGYNIELKDLEVTPAEAQFMKQLVEVMEGNLAKGDFSVNQFAQSLNMSKSTFNRKIKAMTGYTALGFMRDFRIKRAAQLLAQTDLSVKEVFYQTGVANMHLFRTYFRDAYGMSPKEYQENSRR